MNTRHAIFALIISAASCLSGVAIAQDKDVDQADSLDFQSFHKDKKEAIKVWEKNTNTTTKAYQDQPSNNSTTTTPNSAPATTPISSTAVPTANSSAATATAATSSGKRFEIRERYTLTRSAKTPYSAFYVIEPLFKQSAQLCAKGWKKLAERSEPIEQDYYLYYEIECL